MKINVDAEIAITHLLARKRQTSIAALGVTIGVAMYIFMNSLTVGVNRYSDSVVFKSLPHIRIYREDEISKPLKKDPGHKDLTVIVNPKIANLTKNLINPHKIVADIKNHFDIEAIAPIVTVNLFYNNGKSQVDGVASGVNIIEANTMFNIQSTMLDGDLRELVTTSNGILLGVGIVDKLNVKLNDNISVISSIGVIKLMKVVGIFKTSNSATDKSKSYINLASAQELLKQDPNYVTDIDVNIRDPLKAPLYVPALQRLTGYTVEAWQSANEQAMAARRIRNIMLLGISMAILLVAAFVIYNILNMTISQKLNDIAILKATGFSGLDVVKIFVGEALVMGLIGTILGFLFSIVLIKLLARVYIGADIGYFPIQIEPSISINGILVGIIMTLGAGYIPAHKAALVDPISIFRR